MRIKYVLIKFSWKIKIIHTLGNRACCRPRIIIDHEYYFIFFLCQQILTMKMSKRRFSGSTSEFQAFTSNVLWFQNKILETKLLMVLKYSIFAKFKNCLLFNWLFLLNEYHIWTSGENLHIVPLHTRDEDHEKKMTYISLHTWLS